MRGHADNLLKQRKVTEKRKTMMNMEISIIAEL